MNNTSFRDPDGFVYIKDKLVQRFISQSYKKHYQHLINSNLYCELCDRKWLIKSHELDENHLNLDNWYKTLLPEQLEYITQPSQWSFLMLKDAALLTLKIQKLSMAHNMSLKDATPFNVQFYEGRSIFIDTTSFEINNFSKPWVAYRQFCESFLAPLVLMKYGGVELGKILECYPNGIPLEVISGILPFKAKINFGIYLHLILHAKYKNNQGKETKSNTKPFSNQKVLNIIEHLISTIENLTLNGKKDKYWNNYYNETILGNNYVTNKEYLFRNILNKIVFKTSIDLGCNDGVFSIILAEKSKFVISCDFDRLCIDRLYAINKERNITNIYPLCLDLTAPTPSIGFINKERLGFFETTNADLVCGLALIHHLRIGNNIPLKNIVNMFYLLSNKYVIIEFVPKEDDKVKELLSSRVDIFYDYDIMMFQEIVKLQFEILEISKIENSARTLFLLEKK